ncbi:hypothetical protein Dda_3561 [Drechslerella dactyloides]|uniref:RRM domain-containing protein n=1 Tax=Drechslerella dactyloides TaxID=74499 RepID=A0AAD6IY69_DREDA|nr:hypothetical protein Dda_3561 [Drechslerella dactyloides]
MGNVLQRPAGALNSDEYIVLVGNIPWRGRWQDLKDLVREITPGVQRVEIYLTPDGRSRGFGYIIVRDRDEALKVVEQLDGLEWHGRALMAKLGNEANAVPILAQQPTQTSPSDGSLLPDFLPVPPLPTDYISNTNLSAYPNLAPSQLAAYNEWISIQAYYHYAALAHNMGIRVQEERAQFQKQPAIRREEEEALTSSGVLSRPRTDKIPRRFTFGTPVDLVVVDSLLFVGLQHGPLATWHSQSTEYLQVASQNLLSTSSTTIIRALLSFDAQPRIRFHVESFLRDPKLSLNDLLVATNSTVSSLSNSRFLIPSLFSPLSTFAKQTLIVGQSHLPLQPLQTSNMAPIFFSQGDMPLLPSFYSAHSAGSYQYSPPPISPSAGIGPHRHSSFGHQAIQGFHQAPQQQSQQQQQQHHYHHYHQTGQPADLDGDRYQQPQIPAAIPPAPLVVTNSAGVPVNLSHGAVQTENRGIFIGNLPYNTHWRDLRTFLSSAGNIIRCDVPRKPNNKGRGYATVLFASAEDANRACDMFNGTTFQGRQIRVRLDTYANTKSVESGGAGGAGGGAGGTIGSGSAGSGSGGGGSGSGGNQSSFFTDGDVERDGNQEDQGCRRSSASV